MSKTCYLRTHGNGVDPVTADIYDSAHLVEDTSTTPPVVDPVDPVIDPVVPPTIPKTCPQADGKRVTVDGIEYQLFCTKSFANYIEQSGATSAGDIAQCMKDCCKCSPPPPLFVT